MKRTLKERASSLIENLKCAEETYDLPKTAIPYVEQELKLLVEDIYFWLERRTDYSTAVDFLNSWSPK